jgi:hypothetical protein
MRIRAEWLLAACLFAASVGAAELGTLFTTPEERARLDRLRRGDPAPGSEAPVRRAQLTGYVKRSDGRSTVWIDGVPIAVPNDKAGPMLEPEAVRGYADGGAAGLHVERGAGARGSGTN